MLARGWAKRLGGGTWLDVCGQVQLPVGINAALPVHPAFLVRDRSDRRNSRRPANQTTPAPTAITSSISNPSTHSPHLGVISRCLFRQPNGLGVSCAADVPRSNPRAIPRQLHALVRMHLPNDTPARTINRRLLVAFAPPAAGRATGQRVPDAERSVAAKGTCGKRVLQDVSTPRSRIIGCSSG